MRIKAYNKILQPVEIVNRVRPVCFRAFAGMVLNIGADEKAQLKLRVLYSESILL
jgi:hypothetical protein